MPKIVTPPRVGPSLIPPGKGRRQIRVPQPHKVVMPPGKHNKLIPQKPQIFPKGQQKKLVIVIYQIIIIIIQIIKNIIKHFFV